VRDIKRSLKKCDILFTQFSYANWVEGGGRDNQHRSALAREKLERIGIQDSILSPTYIVPYASMVRFCHVDNKYMNDSINEPESAVTYIENETDAKPVLLVPKESWDGKSDRSNSASISFWKNAYAKAMARPFLEDDSSYSAKELEQFSKRAIERVKEKNNWTLVFLLSWLGVFPRSRLLLNDTGEAFIFSWHEGLRLCDASFQEGACISLSSPSLAFVLQNDFGIDTLNVNARFLGKLDNKKRVIRTFSVLALNNTGRFVSFQGIVGLCLQVEFWRQGLRTVGLLR
jgi:hypothetical protein